MFHFDKEVPPVTFDDISFPDSNGIETSNSSIASEMDRSRRDLLDLSLRNPLINYRTLRARGVEAVGMGPEAVFEALVSSSRRMSFAPLEEDQALELIEDGDARSSRSKRYVLQTSEPPDQLQKRLRNTFYFANTTIQEQGVNTLFIALGMVEWFDSNRTDTPRRAPLILIPVELARTNVRERFSVGYSGAEIGSNLSFIEKVQTEHGLEFPSLPEDDDVDCYEYFDLCEEAVSGMDRWRIDRSSVVLGFFAFSKFLMYRDLDPNGGEWTGVEKYGPRNSEIIKSLFETGFSDSGSSIPDDDSIIDDSLPADDVYHVVDADSSQAIAIHDVNQGRNLVIEGPPGTGKSQTISNIIADAISHDRTVLFVSEKMAALEVVKRRLDEIGLGVACLELHSHKTNKRGVLQDLEATWKLDAPIVDGAPRDVLHELNETRRVLNEYAVATNNPVGETGVTPIDARGELTAIREIERVACSLPNLRIDALNHWSAQDFRSSLQTVQDFERRSNLVGSLSTHPFKGCELISLTPVEKEDLRDTLAEARTSLTMYRSATEELANLLGLLDRQESESLSRLIKIGEQASVAPDISGVNLGEFRSMSVPSKLKDLVSKGQEWEKLRLSHGHLVADEGWDADVGWAIDTLEGFEDSRWLKPSKIEGAIEALEKTDRMLGKLIEDANRLAQHLGLVERNDFATLLAMRNLAGHVAERPDVSGFNLSPLRSELTRSEIQALTDVGRARTELRDEFRVILTPTAWDEDVLETRNAIDHMGDKWWRALSGRYRRSRKKVASLCRGEIPSEKERQLRLLDAIIETQRLAMECRRYSANGAEVFGSRWQSEETDFRLVGPVIDWAMEMHDGIDSGRFNRTDVFALHHDADLPTMFQLIERLDASLDALNVHLGEVDNSYSIDGVLLLSGLNDSGAFSFASLRQNLTNRIGIAYAVNKALNHLINISRFGNSDDVERLIDIARRIEDEQGIRNAITSSVSTTARFLGPKVRGLESDWEQIERIRAWCSDLFAAVNDGTVDIADVEMMRNDFDVNEVSVATENLKIAVNEHEARVGNLQKALEYDLASNSDKRTAVHVLSRMATDIQAQLMEQWRANFDELDAFVGYNAAAKEMEERGLLAIVDFAGERASDDVSLINALRKAWNLHILSRAELERPILQKFEGSIHSGRVAKFDTLDREYLELNRKRVLSKHWERLDKVGAIGQGGVLYREFAKKRRHMPVRRLMLTAGNAIQAIKPVFMMSPLSIATYLPPGSVRFDLVVFDEASQVKPVDALGALMRADQAVVVGDRKQLPPTRFFDRAMGSDEYDDEEDDSVTGDLESVLSLFGQMNAPSRMLRWHYRSRHESLINVSNQEFYENRLVVFPSPDHGKQVSGLRHHYLPDTVYDRARSRTNREEALAVAKAAMDHARANPEMTLGVAAFSTAQRNAIEDALEKLRDVDRSCEEFFADHPHEPFFVKNLENVQGDERDVIFISVGYGRDANGNVTMNFGPLNQEGGERRLNVLITRAKHRCEVFSNLRSQDIRVEPGSAFGVRALKTFLEYAETGVLSEIAVASGRDFGSPFQEAVASKLRSLGYQIDEEIESGGRFIDLAVVDPAVPGRYALGIECDGATYHSSRTARERDRIREDHLRDLGWNLHRIWSTDWFRNSERELERARKAIDRALAGEKEKRKPSQKTATVVQRIARSETPVEVLSTDYEVATVSLPRRYLYIDSVPGQLLRRAIISIVRVESPVHVDIVKRRIAEYFDEWLTTRFSEHLDDFIPATNSTAIVRRGEFLWSRPLQQVVVRDRSDLPSNIKKIEYVAPEELKTAIEMVVRQSHGIDSNEAIVETARLLGFKRVTDGVEEGIGRVLSGMINGGDLVWSNGHLVTRD